jgi:hypothetical protein
MVGIGTGSGAMSAAGSRLFVMLPSSVWEGFESSVFQTSSTTNLREQVSEQKSRE